MVSARKIERKEAECGFIRDGRRVGCVKMRYQVIIPPLLPLCGAAGLNARIGLARLGAVRLGLARWLAGWSITDAHSRIYCNKRRAVCVCAPPTAPNGDHCMTPIILLILPQGRGVCLQRAVYLPGQQCGIPTVSLEHLYNETMSTL